MSKNSKIVSASIRVEGGLADKGLIDIHDASIMMMGIARSLNVVAHAFANSNEIRKRASTAAGSQTFIRAAEKGCFEEHIEVHFEQATVRKIGESVISGHFWDYLIATWGKAIGLESDIDSPYLQRLLKSDDLFIDELAEALEEPFQDLHRPITRNNVCKIILARPRKGDVLTFNNESRAFVVTQEVESKQSYVVGNVTRFNILSGYGRLYSDSEQRVMSFLLEHTNDTRMQGLIVKSMQQRTQGDGGKMHFLVSRTVSANGVVKKYTVYDVLEKR
jgi:hypothetical protein